MQEQQPQRSSKNATTGYNQHLQYTANSSDKWMQWIQWADDNGVMAPALIPYQWVRTNAPHKSYTNKALAVMLKDDCIHVEVHATGEKINFFDNSHATPAQQRADKAERERIQRLADEQRQAMHEATAKKATTLHTSAPDAPVSGYMLNKGLTCSYGARWNARLNCWLIGLYDVHGKLWNLQRIWSDGNKRFMKGGRITGCFALLGQLDISTRQILIVEGFATGASIRQETGDVVACAMNAGNLKPTCEAIYAAYPDISIIVCGDDDRAAAVNVGRQKANAAAASVSGKVAFPTFCENCNCGGSDFNDAIQCENSKEATR